MSAKETRTAFPRISPLPLIAELNPCILSPRAMLREFLTSLPFLAFENLFALHGVFDKHSRVIGRRLVQLNLICLQRGLVLRIPDRCVISPGHHVLTIVQTHNRYASHSAMAHSPQGDRVDLLTPPYTAFQCMRTFQQKDIIVACDGVPGRRRRAVIFSARLIRY